MNVGDLVLYESFEHRWTFATIIEVQHGGVHVESLYKIRMRTSGETVWSRVGWIQPQHP